MWSGATPRTAAFLRYVRGFNHPAKLRVVHLLSKALYQDGVPLLASNGARLNVNSRDYIGWALLKSAAYEPLTLARATQILRSGGIFVDVGANVGLFSIYLGVLPNVRCVSVEPHPGNFSALRSNCRRNPCGKFQCYHLAASNTEELLPFEEINDYNLGTARVYSNDSHASNDAFTIAGFPLEKILHHAGVDRPTLMKVDVEGFEGSVLRGIDWEGPYRPYNVLIEFSDYTQRFGGQGRRSLSDFFEQRGFTPYTVEGQPLSLSETPVEDNAWFVSNR